MEKNHGIENQLPQSPDTSLNQGSTVLVRKKVTQVLYPITEHSETKPKQTLNSFDSQLKTLLRAHLKLTLRWARFFNAGLS